MTIQKDSGGQQREFSSRLRPLKVTNASSDHLKTELPV